MSKPSTAEIAAALAAVAIVAVRLLTGHPGRVAQGAALALGVTCVAVLIRRRPSGHLAPALLPLALGSLLVVLQHGTRSLVPLGLGAGVLVLIGLGVDVATPVGAAVGRVAHAIATVTGAALYLITMVPAWAWAAATRLDVLRGGRRARGPSWVVRGAGAGGDATALAAPAAPGRGRRSLTGRITWAVGAVVVLAAGNYGAGWAFDRLTDPTPAEAGPATTTPDPRADLEAMAAYPWRDQYFTDLQRTPGSYWPFTEYRPMAFTSPYINISDDWTRRSYRPAGDPADMPTAWIFGGSTTFGEGQRDEYTIASYVARLAEEAGTPLIIENYGQRGWTHFQEMILFEQELARRDHPDLAVFYDGANEINAQSLMDTAVPTHTLAYSYAVRLGWATVATQVVGPPPVSPVTELWNRYAEHSLVHKAARLFGGTPAGAAPGQNVPPGFTEGQIDDPRGGVYTYQATPQDGTDAGLVYERGKALTQAVAARAGVDAAFYWQPMGYKGPSHERALAEITDPTVDLTDVLVDNPEVFIDGGHTNEEGARIVAEAIWADLQPRIDAWYEAS